MSESRQELKVEGASCEGCVSTIEATLKSISGVTDVSMDLASGIASVAGTAQTSELIEALGKKGYPATKA